MNLDDRYWDTSKFRSHALFAEADFEFENYFKQGSSLCRYKLDFFLTANFFFFFAFYCHPQYFLCKMSLVIKYIKYKKCK